MKDLSRYIDRKNAVRYMGFKGKAPDRFSEIFDECEKLLEDAMTPRSVYIVRGVSELSGILTGDDIASHLSGCDRAVVFAATLGAKVDALIGKYQCIDVTMALILDAEASAAIEAYCDEMSDKIASSFDARLTSRFSPGYGDYPLEVQRDLLKYIDAERKIGVFAGESLMLSPSKSVTAVMGIADSILNDHGRSCTSCEMRDKCAFRREGEDCGL